MAIGQMFPSASLFMNGGGRRPSAQVKPNIPPMYQAHLRVVTDGVETVSIRTPLPENFMLSLGTSWDNPFNQPVSNLVGSSGALPGQAIDTLSTGVTAAMGFTTLNKWLSAAVWTGGSMLKLDLPFVLQAYENPKKEIVETMRELMKLVAPSEYAGKFLKAPGPYMSSPNSEGVRGDEITVNVGNFFTMSPCIIDNVSETFDTQFDENGDPISVTINVSVVSYFTTTKEDLDRFFAPSLG